METPHTFAGSPLDRGEVLRRDEASITAVLDQPGTRFLPFHKLRVATLDAKPIWLTRDELSDYAPEQVVYLGMQANEHRFAAAVAAPGSTEFSDCRLLASSLAIETAGIIAHGRSQLDWHQRNPYCSQCGQPTAAARGGQIRRCARCETHIFPRTDPVAIMLIVDQVGGDRCLLGQPSRRGLGAQFYTALAGFIDQAESIEEAVRREVLEEAGINVGAVNYHSSQPWPFPSQLMIGCHGVAVNRDITFDTAEMADVRWFHRDEVRAALAGDNPDLTVPGPIAIAHHLIKSWVEGEVSL